MRSTNLLVRLLALLSVLLGLNACPVQAVSIQGDDNYRLERLEQKVDGLDHRIKDAGDTGIAVFLFGAFCALWAQNTGRNAWLWFFLGLLFNVITVIVLLSKNSTDNFDKRMYGRTTRDLRP